MKILTGLALAGFLLASHASATPVGFAVGLCGTFSNPIPNSTLTGSFVCPTAASLGVVLPVTAEFLNYNSDYSSGVSPSVTEATAFTFSGSPTFQFSGDTLTSTGAANSNPAACSSGATLNALTHAFGPTVLAGCYDNATGGTLGTAVTVNFNNSFSTGNAISGTGYVEIVYGYGTASVPEPASLLLVGGGLLGLTVFRRKLFGAK
jgi:PEP-CTERM motif